MSKKMGAMSLLCKVGQKTENLNLSTAPVPLRINV
jgi:hypothetical protein